jgi:signal transduction histidine kinase/CheY-like chemotaxis protein/CHASE3 domain sensor protein
MRWLSRYRIGTRLAGSYAAIVVLLVLSWVVTALAMRSVRTNFEGAVLNTDALTEQTFVINKDMLDQETGWRGFLLTGDPTFLQPYDAGQRALPTAFARATRLTDDPTDRRLIRETQVRAGTWEHWVTNQLREWRAGHHSAVRAGVQTGAGKQRFDRFRVTADSLLSHLRDDRQRQLSDSQRTFDLALGILSLIMAGVIGFIVVAGVLLTRSVVNPLRQLRRSAESIRRGYLDAPVPRLGRDELAELGNDMDSMREHLRVRGQLAALLASTLELDTIYGGFAALVKKLVPFDRLSISVADESGGMMRTVFAMGAVVEQLPTGLGQPIDRVITGQAWRTGTPVVRVDAATIPESDRFEDEKVGVAMGIRSVCIVPLASQGRIIGTLNASTLTPGTYDAGMVATLTAIGQPLANAIDNSRLYTFISEANTELERASRMKSEFLANMSHELRTPLNAIIGFSEVLQDETAGDLNDRQQRFVGNVLEAGHHLLALVNDILDIAKVEAGRMELHQEDLDLRALLQEIHATMLPLAQTKGITMVQEVPGSTEVLYADRGRFMQIMYNLLSNAVKFTPEGGTVTVKCEAREGSFAIAVEDTGIGIPAADQSRIFDEFEQVDSSVARTQQGTGLGLALTKRLIELHGGSISVMSEPGHGSVFTVVMPRALVQTGTGEHRGTVLVVEDDPAARELLGVYLAEAGYRVESVSRVEDVATRVRAVKPIAITLDLVLDGELRWSALEQLKAGPETRDIPIVIVSIVDERATGLALGASDYLLMPVSRQALLAAIQGALDGAWPPDRPLRILAVDDQREALELIEAVLENTEHQLMLATSGAEALQLLKRHHPDIMIVDLMMAPVSGFDVIAAVVSDPATSDVPIIVLTAHDLTAGDRARLSGHATAVLSKTELKRAQFLQELQRAVRRRTSPVAVTGDG